MKKQIITILLALALLFQCSYCFAKNNNAKNAKKSKTTNKGKYAESDLKAGTTEVSVNFSGGYNTASATPFIGYFITDEIEIGGGLMVESGDFEGTSYTTTALTLLGRYNVPIEKNLVLFAEAGVEQVDVDQKSGGTDSSLFMLGVGGRIFPSKAFSINFSLDYIIGSYDVGTTDVDTDSIRLMLGLSVFVF